MRYVSTTVPSAASPRRLVSPGYSSRFFGSAWIFRALQIRRRRHCKLASSISHHLQRSDAAANRKSLRRERRQGLALPRGPPRSSKRRGEKSDASATGHCHEVVVSGKLASSWQRWEKVRW